MNQQQNQFSKSKPQEKEKKKAKKKGKDDERRYQKTVKGLVISVIQNRKRNRKFEKTNIFMENPKA